MGGADGVIHGCSHHEAGKQAKSKQDHLSKKQLRRAVDQGGEIVHVSRGTSVAGGIQKDKNGVEGESPQKRAGGASHTNPTS